MLSRVKISSQWEVDSVWWMRFVAVATYILYRSRTEMPLTTETIRIEQWIISKAGHNLWAMPHRHSYRCITKCMFCEWCDTDAVWPVTVSIFVGSMSSCLLSWDWTRTTRRLRTFFSSFSSDLVQLSDACTRHVSFTLSPVWPNSIGMWEKTMREDRGVIRLVTI